MSVLDLDLISGAGNSPAPGQGITEEKLRRHLHDLAEEIVCDLNEYTPAGSQELLSAFVSELFLAATKQAIREERRKKQAEGIAKAKAKGVSFGRKSKPLPDNFEEARQLWLKRELNLKDAAKYCGLPESTFYDAVRRLGEPVSVNPRKPLPENFEESRLLWRSHKLKMKEAAERCGMAATTFYDAVRRVESAEARD